MHRRVARCLGMVVVARMVCSLVVTMYSGYGFIRAAREQENTIFPYLYCLVLVNS